MKIIQYPYLKDKEFLIQMDLSHIKKQWAKITLLNWNESPIQEVQGLITSGSLNITGDSAIRRAGNVSIYLKDDSYAAITDTENLFSINKKMFLEVGFENTSSQYAEYPILWFPLGIFVINSASTSHSSNGTNLSLSFKDKMCLLNGDCGGKISSSVQFDKYDTVDENGNWITTKPTIYQIILELVNHFGEEDMSRIFIEGVDTRVKQCMKWIGENPLYIVGVTDPKIATTNFNEAVGHHYVKYEYGDDAGFIYTDFVYPGELVAKPGDSVVSILDKIKNMLGNFEYFYDIEGNFHFREIKNYLNTTQTTNILLNLDNESYYVFDLSKGRAEYDFTNNPLIISYSNSPQYNKIKNDYVVWGTRTNTKGYKVPIRYHLAIDKKPAIGNSYEVCIYIDEEDGLKKAKKPIDFESFSNFPEIGAEGVFYRDLSNNKIYKWLGLDDGYEEVDTEMTTITTSDWRTELYLEGVVTEPYGLKSNYYFAELEAEWPKIYDFLGNPHYTQAQTGNIRYEENKKYFFYNSSLDKYELLKEGEDYEIGDLIPNTVFIIDTYQGDFYSDVLKHPEDLDYWLDFIDSEAAISKISVGNIGRRTETKQTDEINCVFEPEVPDLIFIETGQTDTETRRDECLARGQSFTQVDSELFSNLAIGGSSNSAFNEVRNLLYQSSSYNESISISTLPIYYLEPNTRITAFDIDSDIHGDYIIKSISLPLDINGTSNISATRALNQF